MLGTWDLAGREEREGCGVLLWDVGREVGKWEDDTAKWTGTGRLIRAGN